MKEKLGPKPALYPLPTVLVGANVDGKANFMTVAHLGISDLGSVSISVGKERFTNRGIKENRTFSVNMPSESMVKVTDHMGMISGRDVDKSGFFDVFYGELQTAPMIDECPVNMECKVIHTVDLPEHDLFVGQVVQTHCSKKYLKDGRIDFDKVRPILFVLTDMTYRSMGETFGTPFKEGKGYESER